ncbi:hypothetical protein R6Z07F_007719 [Ovis aries]
MEPASCVKQSSSRSALRCLRYVPPWERHSAERDEEAGRARERDVTSNFRERFRNSVDELEQTYCSRCSDCTTV